MKDVLYFKKHNDKEGMATLMDEGKEKSVTLKDVSLALLQIINDLSYDTDVSQSIMEARLIAVINSLPEDIQSKIHTEFAEANDDLLVNLNLNEDEGAN